MTRGRKKDFTIPPTRALVQQRDYRARRAQYVADLERRVRKAEEENAQLRTELSAARAAQSPPDIPYSPQIAKASAELMQSLSAASASLTRFQQLAIPDPSLTLPALGSAGIRSPPSTQLSERQLPSLGSLPNTLRPASFPSPAPSPPFLYGGPPSKLLDPPTPHPLPRKKRLYRENSPDSSSETSSRYAPHALRASRSPSFGSECCGGLIDCRHLVESSDEHASDRENTSRHSH